MRKLWLIASSLSMTVALAALVVIVSQQKPCTAGEVALVSVLVSLWMMISAGVYELR